MFKKLLGAVDDSLYFGVILSVFIRWCTSLFPYSGMNKPPMFGDFEAQRHWMEITYHLPVAEWYRQSPNNNLQYWGLDYPPLTAFHSLLMGALSHQLSPRWVALNESRGIAITEHKLFMRNTVVFADLLIFIPAVLLFWHRAQRPTSLRDKAVAAVVCLLYPGLILIDHGHFQYNCISLGLCLWGIVLLREGYCHWASLLYTLALNYKQMELYHAPPFFFYLLGRVWLQHHTTRSKITAVVKLGAVVLGTTAFIWLPFMVPPASPLDVVQRLFPLARGLYEDKVANVWCMLSIFIKLKNLFSNNVLATISAITTLAALVPSSLHLVCNPTERNFRLALVNSSLVFFLFSYQVHEKSILLAALPAMLFIDELPVLTTWFLTVSTFSLFPLLLKDHLVVPFLAQMAIFIATAVQSYTSPRLKWSPRLSRHLLMFWGSTLWLTLLTLAHLVLPAPARYPDLYTLLNCLSTGTLFLGQAWVYHQLQLDSQAFTKLKPL